MAKIYVASSWRNPFQQEVVNILRDLGHEVYDFKNPPHGNGGFQWSDIDPDWQNWTTKQYQEALNHPIAQKGFDSDFNGMQWADVCVMVLPCGRSANTEAAFVKGTEWQAKQSPWISVKERLPDENEDIIILCKHGAIFNGTYSNNVWFCMDGYIHDTYKGNPIYSSMSSIPSSWEPIAWMPIPKFEE